MKMSKEFFKRGPRKTLKGIPSGFSKGIHGALLAGIKERFNKKVPKIVRVILKKLWRKFKRKHLETPATTFLAECLKNFVEDFLKELMEKFLKDFWKFWRIFGRISEDIPAWLLN